MGRVFAVVGLLGFSPFGAQDSAPHPPPLRGGSGTGWSLGESLRVFRSCGVSAAQEEPAAADLEAVGRALSPSLAQVEFTLQHDRGTAPRVFHLQRLPESSEPYEVPGEDIVKEERPYEQAGFLLTPNRVLTPDFPLHPRFVKGIAVRFRGEAVEAKPVAYLKDSPGTILELARPLSGAQPLAFDASKKGPYLAVGYAFGNGTWRTFVQGVPPTVVLRETGDPYSPAPAPSVITDKTGVPVGVCLSGALPLDDSWKGSPEKASAVSAEEMAAALARVEKAAADCLVRVNLIFRSPKSKAARTRGLGEPATEINTIGMIANPATVLVLADLPARQTALLDKVRIYGANGEPVPARFAGTLKDYEALLVTAEKPLPGPAVLSVEDMQKLLGRLLIGAEVYVQGENRICYISPRRIVSLGIGWKKQIRPNLVGEEANQYLFDLEGKLLAIPLGHREKVGEREEWRERQAALLPCHYLAEVLADPAKHFDPANVPLSEEEENRLAWLGVVLQPLNQELARAQGVSEQTQDGSTGAMISYVYPDSPAAKAGVEAGWILLRLHVEDRATPIEVVAEEGGLQNFPWERLDQIDDQIFERYPTPWPPEENQFTRNLTDLGFGKRFTADFAHEGKLVKKEFEVTRAPPNYESAPRFKSEAMGVTVRDLTFEVRRYFQKRPEDPGVIVSKIEPGGKASVAGLKTYEVITHVNDQPVRNVKEFEKLVEGQAELKLAVTRMMKGRVVKVKLEKKSDSERPPEEGGGKGSKEEGPPKK